MVGPDQGQNSDRDTRIHFSPRQSEIIALAAKGLADKEIALQLRLSAPTVRTHLHRFYKDHGVHNRAEAVALWLERAHVSANHNT